LHGASPTWVVVPGDGEGLSLAGARAMSQALEKTGRRASTSTNAATVSCLQLEPKRQAACLVPHARSSHLVVVTVVGIRERVALTAWVVGDDGAPLEEFGDKGAEIDLEGIATSVLTRLIPTVARVEARATIEPPVVKQIVTEAPSDPVPVPPRSRLFEVIGFSVAGVAVVTGAVLGGLGAVQAQRVNSLMPGHVAFSQGLALERQANDMLTSGLVIGLSGAALAMLSAILWFALP